MRRPYNPMPVFSQTAEISYFIDNEYTGKGIGEKPLEFLENKGKDKGISTILANISSLNTGSIKFHRNKKATVSKILDQKTA